LKNVSEAFKKEKERDSNDLKFVLNGLDKEIENSEKEIEEFSDEKDLNFEIEREKENLLLSQEELNDKNLKCISKIKFNNLKEIDLSENNIINIDLLRNISLPYLELLNLSNNQIINIEPLRQINSRKLKYLFIQNNQIEDFQIFLKYKNTNFKTLDILRLENNKINEDSEAFGELKEKYNDIVISSSYFESLKRKYKIQYYEKDDKNVDKNEKEIQLENTRESDSILRELFIIISRKNKNRIKKLNFRSNIIVNPSLLNRIQFDSLEELDLSGNNIKNLDFLKGMKAKKLKYLYLDNNYINDLSPLKNYDFKNVFKKLTITLKENNFNEKDPKISKIKDNIKEVIKLEI
jgi:Leucine-rich repeat (LRR) protein